MATLRQIQANRLNAQKSTGPRTEEGKGRSRANALKHGLTGAGVVMNRAGTTRVVERLDDWRPEYPLHSETDLFLFEQLVVSSVRVELCQAREFDLREHDVERALHNWDQDRRDEAEALARGLAAHPSLVSRRLLTSLHGCEWLIEQWNGLAAALNDTGAWNETQKAHAFDLLGVPRIFRQGREPGEPGETPGALVERERNRLIELRDHSLKPLDDLRRSMAVNGADPQPNPELNRLQKYEAACLRRFRWAHQLLRNPRGLRDEEKIQALATKTLPLTDLLLTPDNDDENSVALEPQTEPPALNAISIPAAVPDPTPTSTLAHAPAPVHDEPARSDDLDAPDDADTPRLPRLDVSMAISPLTRELMRGSMFNGSQSRRQRRAAEKRARRNR